jgi:lysozyme family protein
MQENFAFCLKEILKHEGGWSDHPNVPGGATNKGITLDTYRIYKGMKITRVDLKNIPQEDVEEIYKKMYWDKCSCDELPSGLDLCVFDVAVNSGPYRAKKFLQEVLHVRADGIIGEKTLTAARVVNKREVIIRFSEKRTSFYRSLKTFKIFGKGWLRRVQSVEKSAISLLRS